MKSAKSTRKLFVIGTLAAFFPVALVWFQANRPYSELPLRAETEHEMLNLSYEQGKGAIDKELRKHVSSYTANVDTQTRWQELQRTMIEHGAGKQEAQNVLDSAQTYLQRDGRGVPKPYWPIDARRGWVKKKPVWIIITAWPYPPKASVNPLALPWRYQISIIDPADVMKVVLRNG